MKDPEDVKYNNEKITRKPLVLEHKISGYPLTFQESSQKVVSLLVFW